VIAALAALTAAGVLAAPPPTDARTVVQTDKTWVCKSAVDLDVVSVTMTPSAPGGASGRDAVHLQPGCTGRIGELDVTTSIADGVKVAEGAHDLEIDGGSIHCLAKAPTLHQDGIQVMGGDSITFHNMKIDCGRPGESLINSNMFFNMAGRATLPPTDVVCDGCQFGGGAAHTVLIQRSVRSGVSNSILCRAKYPNLTLTIGSAAVDPVNVSNTLEDCGTGGPTGGGGTTKLSLKAKSSAITFGGSVLLTGSFGKAKENREVTMYARPFGTSAFAQFTTVRTDASGAWQVVVRPRIATSYRAVSKASTSGIVLVGVRPRVTLTRAGSGFRANASAKTSFRGKPFLLQRQSGGGWRTVARGKLGATVKASVHGARLRALVPAAPGYLQGLSAPLTVR